MFRYQDAEKHIRTDFDLSEVRAMRAVLSDCRYAHPVFQDIAQLFTDDARVFLSVKQAEMLDAWLWQHRSIGIEGICSNLATE